MEMPGARQLEVDFKDFFSGDPLPPGHWKAVAIPEHCSLFHHHSLQRLVLSAVAYFGDCAMASLENSEPDILEVPRSESPLPATPTNAPTDPTRVKFEGVAPHPPKPHTRATQPTRRRTGGTERPTIPGVSAPPVNQAGKGESVSVRLRGF